jgi:hypothetical protein
VNGKTYFLLNCIGVYMFIGVVGDVDGNYCGDGGYDDE